MGESARESGRDLQHTINEARALSDEMQLINEACNNLAERMERLAERNREAAERLDDNRTPQGDAPEKRRNMFEEIVETPSDFPVDPMLDRDVYEGADAEGSRAESDLRDALHKSGRKHGGRR